MYAAATKVVYTVFSENKRTLTYYYNTKYDSSNPYHELYDPVNNPNAERFSDYCMHVSKVVIDPSMKNAPLTSMENMFYGGNIDEGHKQLDITDIEGLENLNTANVTNMRRMFYRCFSLTSLDLSSFNTAKVTNMSEMFYDCSALTSLDLSSFNTAKVTNMSEMFYWCSSLKSLDLGAFNTAKVTNMSEMFYQCSSLTSLDLSSFNTSRVKDMQEMFRCCSALTSLDLSSFNTAKVTDMSKMFYDCSALKSLNLSAFNTAKVTNMSYMFYNCSALKSLNLSSFNTANVTNMSYMFENCSALKSIDLSSFNTANVEGMGYMFSECKALTLLDLCNFNVTKVRDTGYMFQNCLSLKTIYCNDDWSENGDISGYDMFSGCTSLVGGKGTTYEEYSTSIYYARPDGGTESPGYFTKKRVYTVFNESKGTLTYRYDGKYDLSNPYHELYDPVNEPNAIRFRDYNNKVKKAVIDPSMKSAPLTSMNKMFYGGYIGKNNNLPVMTTIEGLENLNTAQVTTMENMFCGCQSLTSLDLSAFNTKQVTDMNGMFIYCSSLQTLDVNSFDIGKVTNMASMFAGCSELTTIYCKTNWSSTTASSGHMFENCKKLVGGKGTPYYEYAIDATYAHPDGGLGNPGYFTAALLKGDANNDGQVTAADIVDIMNYMMGNPPADFSKGNADVNLDGIINIADIVAVSNILINE